MKLCNDVSGAAHCDDHWRCDTLLYIIGEVEAS